MGHEIWHNTRVHCTPFTPRIEAAGVTAYSVYNHTLLPLVFRGVEEDYRHLKEHVQLWDVSCQRQVEVRGPDAAALVQQITCRDLSGAQPGRAYYAPIVDHTGGVLNDPVIFVLADDRYWISLADLDVGLWITGLAHAWGLAVEVSEPDVSTLAVQGPKADELVARVFGDEIRQLGFFRFTHVELGGHDLLVARTGWSKQGGFEICVDRPDLALKLWDALWDAGQDLDVGPGCPNVIERIEGGLLSWGGDITRADNPFECGFDRFVHLDRPIDFVGRAALERIAAEGIDRRIVGLLLDAERLPACRTPWHIEAGHVRVGEVRSAVYSPARGCGVGIAMVGRDAWDPGHEVVVRTPDGPVAARVSEIPFPTPAA